MNSCVQFSRSVMSDSLWPHGLQHTRLPCSSPSPGACSDSCPLSWWCHPAISSSVVPFSSCLQSFQASESFQMSQLFTYGGQIIGVSASASVLPMNIQDWFPLGLTGFISLQSKGFSKVLSNTTIWKHQLFAWGGQIIGVSASASVLSKNIQDWSPLGWTGWTSLQPKELSRVFFCTTIRNHQFFSAQPSLWSSSHVPRWLLEGGFP